MNKSKFLKKSLAMLLAMLMVVAMIPLSAAADDVAPEEPTPAPSVAAPDVTVNNRNTVKPEQAGDPYTVTVLDATSVSMSWVPVDGYKAQIVTARDVTIGVPFNMLDLLQEGKVIEENEENNSVTYQVTFQLVATEGDNANEVAAEWPLNITVVNTIPNDDTTIKAVIANQSFRNGDDDFAFLGIKGNVNNAEETITITLPIGMSPADAGFATVNFGAADTAVSDNNDEIAGVAQNQNIAKRVAPAGEDLNALASTDDVDKIVRRVFVPTSVYSTVDYAGPSTADGAGTLVVTARDGRTRNYTVLFEQEEVFESLSVTINGHTHSWNTQKIVNTKTTGTGANTDINNTNSVEVEYIIPVDVADLTAGTATINWQGKNNVVRVEDPNGATIATSANADHNVPILNARNTVTLNPVGTSDAKDYVITVKTEANMGPNKTGFVNSDFFKNVRITLRPKTAEDTGTPALYELQLNGYDSIWNEDNELPTTIDVWADYDFEFSTGDGQHPARISATVNGGNSVSIPAQDKDLVANSYWAVEKTEASDDRLLKPNSAITGVPWTTTGAGYRVANCFIDNVNTEGGSFVLRVWAGDNYKDYTINIHKPSQNTGTAVSAVKLVKQMADGSWKYLEATKSADGRVWTFEVDDKYGLLSGAPTVTAVDPGFALGGTIADNGDDFGTATALNWPSFFNVAADANLDATLAFAGGGYFATEIIKAAGGTNTFNVNAATDTATDLTVELVKDNDELLLKATVNATDVELGRAAIPTAATADPIEFKRDVAIAGATLPNVTVATIVFANMPNTGLTDVTALDVDVAITGVTMTHAAPDPATTVQYDAITGVTDPGAATTIGTNAGKTYTSANGLFTLDATDVKATRQNIYKILQENGVDEIVLKDIAANVSFTINERSANGQSKLYLVARCENADGTFTNVDVASADFDNTQNLDHTFTFAGEVAGAPVTIGTFAGDTTGVGSPITIAGTAWNAAGLVISYGNLATETAEMITEAMSVEGEIGGQMSVNAAAAAGWRVIVDTPYGAVVTPGGTYNTKKTPIVGLSTWGVGNGFNEQFKNNGEYAELEEGVTTLADWWNLQSVGTTYDYLINMQKNGPATNNIDEDGMVFSVKNGRNGIKQPYVIRFKRKAAAKGEDGAAITVDTATTAIDEDLVYGGSTVDNAIIMKNSNIVSNLVNAMTAYVRNAAGVITDELDPASVGTEDNNNNTLNEYYNKGFINPENAAYIGAIGGHNEFLASDNKVTVAKVPNTAKEYVITVHVPADFMTSNDSITTDFVGTPNDESDDNKTWGTGAIFFTDLLASDGAVVYRNAGETKDNAGATGTDAGPDGIIDTGRGTALVPTIPFAANTWVHDTDAIFNLSGTDATQQAEDYAAADSTKRFEFSNNDLSAWKGGIFNSDKVSQSNILYVFKRGNAAANADPVNVAAAKTDSDAIYYVTVVRDADKTGDKLTSVSAVDEKGVVSASVNQALKTVTVNVPASYNWIGTRDNGTQDFELNFTTDDGAILIDAVSDDAFGFRNNGATNGDADFYTYKNFTLTDLVQQEQDVNKWVPAEDAANATKFFVKDNELFIYNPNTGAAQQITGMGDEIKDAYINPSWRLIMDQEAELRVYPEGRNNVNTYKLILNILPESSIANLTHVQVDESTAEIDNDARTAVVSLPDGTDYKQVRISVGVNGLSTVVSVAGEPYDPNNNTTYDITDPITIVIAAENGTQYTYTLTAGDLPEPSPSPSAEPSDEPSPTPSTEPTLPSDMDKVTPSLREDVIKALTNGLMQGGPDGLFYPTNPMKRYEFALVVARASLREEGETGTAADLDKILIEQYGDKTTKFADVNDSNWGGTKSDAAVAAINMVIEKNLMLGVSDTAFAPTGSITREQAALIMARVAGLDMTDTDVSNFADASKISSWAKGGVAAAVKAGIMNGTGNDNFTPLRVLQRQEGAAILARYYVDGNGKPEPEEPENPDEGDEGDEPSTPDEGDEGDEPSTPDEGDEGDEPSTPDEGGEDTPSTPDEGDDDTSSTPEGGDEGDSSAAE